MPEGAALAAFLTASLALLLVPGPAVLYIVARSVHQGRLAGIVSCAGIAVGTLFHVAAAAAGISAILVRSALAFQVLKYLGAAYLIWLGVRKLTGPSEADLPGLPGDRSLRRVFLQGIVVNVLNPKTALFFFAFLPQFVDPGRGSAGLQVLLLGILFLALGFLSDGIWALAAGALGRWLRGHLGFLRAQRWIAGGVYLGLGACAALAPARSD